MEYGDPNFWQPHFSDKCSINVRYHSMSDGVQILSIYTMPNNPKSTKHPVVLIPGWFSQIFAWEFATRVISEDIPLLYIETREKNSSKLDRKKSLDMGVERLTEDVEKVLADYNELSFSNCIAVGSSLGGSIWIDYLATRQSMPWVSVLVGPNPKFKFPPVIGKLLLSLPLFMIGLARKYVKWHILKFRLDPKKEPEQAQKYIRTFDEADSWKIRQSARHVTKFNGWELLSQINSNVILAGASSDKLHAAERTIRIGKKIRGSKYIDFKSNKRAHDENFGNFLIELSLDHEIPDIQLIENVKLKK